MFELSWPGVRYCMEALRTPKPRHVAVHAVAEVGGIQPSTAYKYLRLAEQLGLVVQGADGRCMLATRVKRPEELVEASALVRLFHVRQRLTRQPLSPLDAEHNPFEPFQIHPSVLRSAMAMARHLPQLGEELPPHAAMMLELMRLWVETQAGISHVPPMSAAVAFQVFKRLSGSATGVHPDAVEAFIRACMLLYGKRLVRLSIMQYATDENRAFAPFRTQLGYIKWIHTPLPYRGPRDAEPVQAPRKLVSFG